MVSQNELEFCSNFFYWLTISNFLYIIILLILAAISIGALVGEDGLFSKAKESGNKSNLAQEKENNTLNEYGEVIDEYLNTSRFPKELKVGDYISLETKLQNETYTTNTLETGYSSSQTFSTNKDAKWRIISVNNNKIEVVADRNTIANDTKGLFLGKQAGVINTEKVLDDLCKKLYNTPYGIARSIKVEDINRLTGQKEEDLITGSSYMATVGEIWDKESNTFKDASTITGGIEVEYTHYTYTIDENIPLYDILVSGTKGAEINNIEHNYPTWYWLGRCTKHQPTASYYRSRALSNGEVGSPGYMYMVEDDNSNTIEMGLAYGVRPIVTLDSKVELTKSSASTTEKVIWEIQN